MNEDRSPVPENDDSPPSPSPPILAEAEVSRRTVLLAELQGALAAQGVQSVFARRRRLVLRSCQHMEPSGLTDPQLYIFGPDGTDIATTDGSTYRFASGKEYPAGDPAAARAVECLKYLDGHVGTGLTA